MAQSPSWQSISAGKCSSAERGLTVKSHFCWRWWSHREINRLSFFFWHWWNSLTSRCSSFGTLGAYLLLKVAIAKLRISTYFCDFRWSFYDISSSLRHILWRHVKYLLWWTSGSLCGPGFEVFTSGLPLPWWYWHHFHHIQWVSQLRDFRLLNLIHMKVVPWELSLGFLPLAWNSGSRK